MKRLEKRERENLSRIFYTIIKNNDDYSFKSTFVRGNFHISIQQVAIPETPLPTYSIVIIREDRTYFELIISFSISIGNYGNFEVRNFKSTNPNVIKEVIKAMKYETD